MNCHCCHWVEMEAVLPVDEVQPSNDTLPSENTGTPSTEPSPSAMCRVYVDNEIRAFLLDLKELTEEGLLTANEASTLRLEFMRSHVKTHMPVN